MAIRISFHFQYYNRVMGIFCLSLLAPEAL